MLTRELAIAEYDFGRGRVLPDRLTSRAHRRYLDYAERMLIAYRTGCGRTRQELHRDVHNLFADEPDCPPRRIDAFCKLLDEAAVWQREAAGCAAALRREVFRMAAAAHPLVARPDRLFEHGERELKAAIAARLGRTWADIDRELFADVIEFHRLERFDGYADARALLSRYNVAQVQAALYDAVSLTVWAEEDLKPIVRAAKLAGLMHTIARGAADGYEIRCDGPASVLRETRRYGAAMARFLPALIACRGWRLHAVLRTRRRGWPLALDLSADDGLTSHVAPPEPFDSAVEASFARKWGSEPRDGWTLIREGDVLCRGQKVFFPDFTFRHADGRTVLLEIVGFWTADYIQAKLRTLHAFADQPILLALAAPARELLTSVPPNAICYKSALRVKDVLERLNRVRVIQA